MDEKVRQRQALFELREKTLGQILDETVARIPDKEAIVYADRNYRQTWREFADTVDLFAKGLMALGVQKGEKVAVWASRVWSHLLRISFSSISGRSFPLSVGHPLQTA